MTGPSTPGAPPAHKPGPRRRARWLNLAFVTLWVAWFSGCLSFPRVPEASEVAAGQPPKVATARGVLSARQSAAIIEELKKKTGAVGILERHVALEEAVAGRPLVTGNRVSLLIDGPATYKSMFDAIAAARDHINLETYIFEDDEIGRRFADVLLAKQSRGVQVNIIYDSVGSVKTPRDFFERLRKSGIRVLEFAPVNPLQMRRAQALTHRDHRKLLVVDGRVAFLGGVNISSVYTSSSFSGTLHRGDRDEIPWRDTHVRIEGPVVRDFQELFLGTWRSQHGDPLPQRNYFPTVKPVGDQLVRAIGSDADEAESPIYLTLVSAINNAETNIDITVAYFIPDAQLLEAITGAAARGVRVTMIMPSQSDFWAVFNAGRARYQTLLASGVRIYERRSALLHAKTMLIDDAWSTIGSTNFDPLSFLHNDEINAVVLGYDFAKQMRAMFQMDLQQSDEITLERWERRPLTDRLKEWAARLWEYWM